MYQRVRKNKLPRVVKWAHMDETQTYVRNTTTERSNPGATPLADYLIYRRKPSDGQGKKHPTDPDAQPSVGYI